MGEIRVPENTNNLKFLDQCPWRSNLKLKLNWFWDGITMANAQTMLRQAYLEMPPVTRVYTTACVITTLAVQLEIVSPFQLYFNPLLILRQYQIWRLVTTFLFNMIFTYRYCRMLEEGSFRGKSSDFVMMFLFGAISMITFAFFVNLLFLGQAFTIMLVYVWARRNPYIRMNFFGLLTF